MKGVKGGKKKKKRLETISIPDGFLKRLEFSFILIARYCSLVYNKNPEFFAQ